MNKNIQNVIKNLTSKLIINFKFYLDLYKTIILLIIVRKILSIKNKKSKMIK